jgi:hypothetical protein
MSIDKNTQATLRLLFREVGLHEIEDDLMNVLNVPEQFILKDYKTIIDVLPEEFDVTMFIRIFAIVIKKYLSTLNGFQQSKHKHKQNRKSQQQMSLNNPDKSTSFLILQHLIKKHLYEFDNQNEDKIR